MSDRWYKNPRTISLAFLFVGEVAVAILLFASIKQPDKYGFVLLGAAIGWMLYYFIRRYRVFSPKSLAATLSAVIGGEALAWLTHLRGSSVSVEPQYFTGLGVGFFFYALYAGFCSWLYAVGVITSPVKFEAAVGCGIGISRDLDEVEAMMKFEECVRNWSAGRLTDQELESTVNSLDITRRKLAELIDAGESDLQPEEIEKIKTRRIVPLHATA